MIFPLFSLCYVQFLQSKNWSSIFLENMKHIGLRNSEGHVYIYIYIYKYININYIYTYTNIYKLYTYIYIYKYIVCVYAYIYIYIYYNSICFITKMLNIIHKQ